MSGKNKLSGYYQAALFTAVMGIIVLAIASITFSTLYKNSLVDIAQLEERIESEKDSYYAEIFARPPCKDNETRIEYLEGQLESCNRAYEKEKHNREYYQDALENFSSYCSEGLNQLVIDDLREELSICRREKLGAPCHPHPDGIHCGWGPCNTLYDCVFGELGWIGPDRVMCDNFGNTSYNEARTACFSDRNCSSCIQMTDGDLGHCYAFSYYP